MAGHRSGVHGATSAKRNVDDRATVEDHGMALVVPGASVVLVGYGSFGDLEGRKGVVVKHLQQEDHYYVAFGDRLVSVSGEHLRCCASTATCSSGEAFFAENRARSSRPSCSTPSLPKATVTAEPPEVSSPTGSSSRSPQSWRSTSAFKSSEAVASWPGVYKTASGDLVTILPCCTKVVSQRNGHGVKITTSSNTIVMSLQDRAFSGILRNDTVVWSDGDCWVRESQALNSCNGLRSSTSSTRSSVTSVVGATTTTVPPEPATVRDEDDLVSRFVTATGPCSDESCADVGSEAAVPSAAEAAKEREANELLASGDPNAAERLVADGHGYRSRRLRLLALLHPDFRPIGASKSYASSAPKSGNVSRSRVEEARHAMALLGEQTLALAEALWEEQPTDESLPGLFGRALCLHGRRREAEAFWQRVASSKDTGQGREDAIKFARILAMVEAEKKAGNSAYQESRWDAACDAYTRAIEADPCRVDRETLASVYGNRSATHRKLGQFTAALEDAEQSLHLCPSYDKALFRRGCARMDLEHYKEALADLQEFSRREQLRDPMALWRDTEIWQRSVLGEWLLRAEHWSALPSGTKQNYYSELGVPMDATADEIKKAHKRMALKWHPDKAINGSQQAYEDKFKKIQLAFDFLSGSDSKTRSMYDFGVVIATSTRSSQSSPSFRKTGRSYSSSPTRCRRSPRATSPTIASPHTYRETFFKSRGSR